MSARLVLSLAVTAEDAASVQRLNAHTSLARELLDLLVISTEAGANPRLEDGVFRADVGRDAPRRVSVAAETLEGREPQLVRLFERHLSPEGRRRREAEAAEAEREAVLRAARRAETPAVVAEAGS